MAPHYTAKCSSYLNLKSLLTKLYVRKAIHSILQLSVSLLKSIYGIPNHTNGFHAIINTGKMDLYGWVFGLGEFDYCMYPLSRVFDFLWMYVVAEAI